MMLLTFDEFSDIPSKMYIFYRKAFEVLYRKHDTLKPQYTREFYTSLSEDDFVRLFETFCFFSFCDELYSFEGDEIFKYAKEAIGYDGGQIVSEKHYVSDVVENVCVILKEGENYNFLHRSFQEYFAACFVIGRGRDDLTEIVEGLGTSLFDTSVMEFISEMNREALDRTYLRKLLPKILDDLKKCESDSHAFNLFYNEFSVRSGDIVTHTFVSNETLPKYAIHLHIVETIYGRREGYDGAHVLIRNGVISVDEAVLSRKKQVVVGPDSAKDMFDRVLSKSGFKSEMTRYMADLLESVTEVQNRRDALTAKRALSRRVL